MASIIQTHFFEQPPCVCVDDFRITTAPTVAAMHQRFGTPSRIDTGETPAPAGHRNNQIHVYDELGITLNEHHHTRLLQLVTCWFATDDPHYRFTPHSNFTGQLQFENVTMPLGGDIRQFLGLSPFQLNCVLTGSWSYVNNEFAIFVNSRGRRLPSGRRSKVQSILSIDLFWPHDLWQEPVTI
ncbi:MAG: hypothetical protein SGJ20_19215 [Planctomycetota bacterium]|nr:hypothetical protein [Planctomycetota bacterium]